ncbi:hypothetical protein BXZ70DRAFT_490312 [Cristinia sonorae]|uniref:Serine-threonine/tyrosine-protein kinase catalytic domain-containing protein n=1 Tax=Cristinia sonorae TaxID=1940300 RepID=A0A8K0XLI6_9AGAR|nr:hypothetical protein BXZ70DRAFT_490312 [Cristinia sonorae]
MYASACVIYEMYAGHPPFAQKSTLEVSRLLAQGVQAPCPAARPMSDSIWRLTTLCWAQKRGKRPSADDGVKDLCRICSGANERDNSLAVWYSSRTLLKRILSAVPVAERHLVQRIRGISYGAQQPYIKRQNIIN